MSRFNLGFDGEALAQAIDDLGDTVVEVSKAIHRSRPRPTTTPKPIKRTSRPRSVGNPFISKATGKGIGELLAELQTAEVAAAKASSTPVDVKAKATRSQNDEDKITDKVWNDLVRKANKWAEETAAEMRASVPVDTGNLLESIHVLKDECVIDRGKGEITMVVGADLDPAGGHGRLYAPPMRKRSPKYGRKTPPWKGYRLMPVPDNEYASKFLGDVSVEEKFKDISKKNAKKIMGK